jgi:hypothetical protein
VERSVSLQSNQTCNINNKKQNLGKGMKLKRNQESALVCIGAPRYMKEETTCA